MAWAELAEHKYQFEILALSIKKNPYCLQRSPSISYFSKALFSLSVEIGKKGITSLRRGCHGY
ncbi:hypothetical protein [Desulfovibrio inopinatus]|uniref:hypothetical protein n=1 Tax=Desulfovibrio inopinatus TaxID=102109 RepID=UPI0012EB3571|nr:hypothetical protein [Desulfovibrio inopinatus]